MRAGLLTAACVMFLVGCGASSSDSEALPTPNDAASDEIWHDAAAEHATDDASAWEAGEDVLHDGATGSEAGIDSGQSDSAEDSGWDAAPPPQEVVDFLTQWFKAQCSAMASCCDAAGLGYNPAACTDDSLSYVVKFVPSDATLNKDRIDACLGAVSGLYSQCTPKTSYNFDWHAEEELFHLCAGVIEGKAQPGEACSTILDCAATADGMTDCLDGHCQWILLAKEGEPCEFMSDAPITHECSMPDGFYCGEDDTCKPIGQPGEPCSSSMYPSCYEGVCPSATSTCSAVLGLGDSCGSSDLQCTWDLRCSNATKKCVTAGTAGEACAEDVDCLSLTCIAGRCSPKHHHMIAPYGECTPPN